MKLTLRQLEIFVAIARAENVSRAAQALALSQSAASSALVELERLYDCPLFDRVGKSLRLNGTGRGLLLRAELLLDQAREVEAYLGGQILGPVHIGATLTIGNYLAPLILADYLQRHPESQAKLKVANTDAVVRSLLEFDCDLGLIEGKVRHPDLEVQNWVDDELVICCAPGHGLAGSGNVSNEMLAQQSWILREPGSGTRQQFDDTVAPALATVRIGLELEHTEAIKRAVESNLGISCLSRLALREALRRSSLVELPTPQFDMRRQFHLVRHRQRHAGAAVRALMALCTAWTQADRQGRNMAADWTLPFIP